jgi:hypothetical protein
LEGAYYQNSLLRHVNEVIDRHREIRRLTDRYAFMDNQKDELDARETKKPTNQEILAKFKRRK